MSRETDCPDCDAVKATHRMCRGCAEKDMAAMMGVGVLGLPADWFVDVTPRRVKP